MSDLLKLLKEEAMPSRRQTGIIIPAILACLLSGCALARSTSTQEPLLNGPEIVQEDRAPEPQPSSPASRSRALLLGTEAVQLGPGLGKNAYRWMGDGQWGF
jgi:hypothetical protein